MNDNNSALSLNQIYNGNCLEIMQAIPNESVDLIVTDPPYRTTPRGRGQGQTTTSGGIFKSTLGKQGKMFDYNDIKPTEYLPEFYRVLKDGTHCYVMTNNKNLLDICNTAVGCGFKFIKCLIWDKGNKVMGTHYMSQFEYIVFLRKGKSKNINNCGTPDILYVPNKKMRSADGKNIHNTEKPVPLMMILVENSSNVGDLVLDPFVGIGSTCIASKTLRRNFIGIDIEKRFCNVTNERLEATKVI